MLEFNRREWLGIVAISAIELLGKPGQPMTELPEDDEEESTSSMSCCGSASGWTGNAKLLHCDGCSEHFSYYDLDHSPGKMLLRMPGGNVWLCDQCGKYHDEQMYHFNSVVSWPLTREDSLKLLRQSIRR